MNTKEFLEPSTKFSQSLLWKLQEEAYMRFGPKAWSEKGVPFYLTGNPWTADAYLQVVHGFFLDLEEEGKEGVVYLFDLGAGSGRLGYLFLKEWVKCNFKKLKLCYVMCDMVEANLEFLKSHPLLNPFIEKGILDFCYFHHDQKDPLVLQIAKKTIDKLSLPCVLVANYFFDTVPQDLFKAEKGKLLQGMVALKVEGPIQDRLDPKWIEKVECEYSFQPFDVEKSPWKELLKEHAEEFPEATFLFPEGALKSLEYFSKLSQGKFLLLAGDQAASTKEQFKKDLNPKLDLHSTFSMKASYYTLKRYFELKGGAAWLPKVPATEFTTLGAVMGVKKNHTEYAYQTAIAPFDPWAYWQLVQKFEPKIENLRGFISLIRVGKGDPMTFYAHFAQVRKWLMEANEQEKNDLLQVIKEVAENFYPVGERDADFILDLGVLCVDMKVFREAQMLFGKALHLGGDKTLITRNLRAIQHLVR